MAQNSSGYLQPNVNSSWDYSLKFILNFVMNLRYPYALHQDQAINL